MQHRYFFLLNDIDKEMIVFYMNYDFLVVPQMCITVPIEDIYETEIVRKMIDSSQISNYRRKQLQKLLIENENAFYFINNFPFYVGKGDLCSFIAKIKHSKNISETDGKRIVKEILNNNIDLLGNVYIYERIKSNDNLDYPVLNDVERYLFVENLKKQIRQNFYSVAIKNENIKKTKELNLRDLNVVIARHEERIIENNAVFKTVIDTVVKNLSTKKNQLNEFFSKLKANMQEVYRCGVREYCSRVEKYFLGSILYIDKMIKPDILTFLSMVSPLSYTKAKKDNFKTAVVLGRQDTSLMMLLCGDEIENFLTIIPNSRFSLFETVFINCLKEVAEEILIDC